MVLEQSQYSGLALSIGAYLFTCWLRNKTGLAILNSLLVLTALVIGYISGVGMDYETYNKGISYLGWLLTPVTACLATPLYKQLHLLKKHGDAVTLGITAGVAINAVNIFLMCKVLGLTHTHYVILPSKSITMATSMKVSEEAGGIVTLTVMSIVLTGVLGDTMRKTILRLVRAYHPVTEGLALRTNAHAMGAAKVLELGEIEGAMNSLSIVVAGLVIAVVVLLVASLI